VCSGGSDARPSVRIGARARAKAVQASGAVAGEDGGGVAALAGERLRGVDFAPSPPAEKATTRQDQAGQASTRDGAGNRLCINEVIHSDQILTWQDFVRPQCNIAVCYPDTADFGRPEVNS
jgi:hypothetical protein